MDHQSRKIYCQVLSPQDKKTPASSVNSGNEFGDQGNEDAGVYESSLVHNKGKYCFRATFGVCYKSKDGCFFELKASHKPGSQGRP
jgi:hypothetical protein